MICWPQVTLEMRYQNCTPVPWTPQLILLPLWAAHISFHVSKSVLRRKFQSLLPLYSGMKTPTGNQREGYLAEMQGRMEQKPCSWAGASFCFWGGTESHAQLQGNEKYSPVSADRIIQEPPIPGSRMEMTIYQWQVERGYSGKSDSK